MPTFVLHMIPCIHSTMKFLVFGGGGKVARHLTRIASKEGNKVVCVVRNGTQWASLFSYRPSAEFGIATLTSSRSEAPQLYSHLKIRPYHSSGTCCQITSPMWWSLQLEREGRETLAEP